MFNFVLTDLAALIFCGYIIYDTDNLIKRYTYDEYVWAAVALYLNIINLFLSLLTLFRASDFNTPATEMCFEKIMMYVEMYLSYPSDDVLHVFLHLCLEKCIADC
uniref:Uncharacterized protein n=1 Tax=Ananas comosus var. bracteatus TaxID=296719 RepID=A0A6V7QYA8_ANACO